MTTEIVLMRQDRTEFHPKEKQVWWRTMCDLVDGFSEDDRRAWRALLGAMANMEPGEMLALKVHVPRMSGTHKRHFSMEGKFFAAQEVFDNEEAFRDWLKVGARFVEWVGEEGQLVPVPRSLNWTDIDELEMRRIHLRMVAFLRKPEASARLWPHLTERAREEMVNGILKGFDE